MNGGDSPGRSSGRSRRRDAVRGLFASLPQGVEARYDALQVLRQEFHRELAAAFEGTLSDYLKKQPQDTVDARRDLALSLFETLQSLGLSMAFPHTRQPAVLVADDDGGQPGGPRYHFEIRTERDHKLPHSQGFADLPDLQLVPAQAPFVESVYGRLRSAVRRGRGR